MTANVITDSEKYFYLHEGGELTSLEDLFTELQTMEPHVYNHHVNEEKNDFANWVRDVMDDKFLARNIQLKSEKDDLLRLLFVSLFR